LRVHRHTSLVVEVLAALVLLGCGTDPTPAEEPDAGPTNLPGTLTLGTHEQGLIDPATFEPFSAGDTAPIVLGSANGAWMLVGASRFDALPDGIERVTVRASLTDVETGAVYANVVYKLRGLVLEGDAAYLLNQFVVVPDDFSWDGQPALFSMTWRLEDPPFGEATGSVQVVMARQDPAVLGSAAP
jgi:hypothetical protein